MKKILNILLIGMIAILTLGSCDKDLMAPNVPDNITDKGNVSFASMTITISNVDNVINRSASPDINSFTVNIIDKATSKVVNTWLYKNMPEIITLPVGDYTAEVKSHDVKPAAWDEPFFYGSSDFTIKKDDVVTIDPIVCKLKNIKVTILFDDELKAVMGTDVVVNVSVGGKGSLDFAYNETRSGYFEYVESATLLATFSGTVDGVKETGYKIYVDITPGQHRIITYSLKNPGGEIPPQFGEMAPSILVDATLKTIDLTYNVSADEDIIDPDPSDPSDPTDPVDPPVDPSESTPSIKSTSLNLTGVNTIVEGMVADVDITAPNGIKKFEVDIISEQLNDELLVDVGLASHFDLAAPGALKEGLEGLGFPTGDGVIGKTTMKFDISSFMDLLKIYAGTHKFKITITDAKNLKAVSTLTFLAQ